MADPIAFIHETTFSSLPPSTVHHVKRALLDQLGVMLTGTQTACSGIIYDFCATVYPGPHALFLDGRRVSPVGATLAHAMTSDSVDMHDGHQVAHGHPGAALVPAALALLAELPARLPGPELLATLAVGYEVALRAGATLTDTVHDYHSSGSWNAVGVAAMYARAHRLSTEATRHALGIAEYYAPRSQMMRCIDFPTMVKDGTGWGAMVGMMAGALAKVGFTGAPAVTVEIDKDTTGRVGASALARDMWESLGVRWEVANLVYKKHALCAWSQTVLHGVRKLRDKYDFTLDDIVKIKVETFHEASRMMLLSPTDTEAAQYSLPFAVGAGLVHGIVTVRETQGDALKHKEVTRLARLVEVVETEELSRLQPGRMLSIVSLETADGRLLSAPRTAPEWFEEDVPTDAMLTEKFRRITLQVLDEKEVESLSTWVWGLDKLGVEKTDEVFAWMQKVRK